MMKHKAMKFMYDIVHTAIWIAIIILYLSIDHPHNKNDVLTWMTSNIILIFLIVLMYSKSTYVNKDTLEYQNKNKQSTDLIHMFFIIGAGFFLNMLVNTLYTSFFSSDMLPNDELIMKNAGLYIPFYIGVCLATPIFEEIIFRGYFYVGINHLVKLLSKKYQFFKCAKNEKRTVLISYVLISSTVFGVLHKQADFFSFLTYMLFGVILAAIFIITKRIWPGIIFHALNNTYAVLSLVYIKNTALNEWYNNLLIGIATVVFPLLAIFYPFIKAYILNTENKIHSNTD